MKGAWRHDPWIRYRDTTLYAVPSVHCRLVFAQLVVEACRRKRFDVIAVELPQSLGAGWLRRVGDITRGTHLLVSGHGAAAPIDVLDQNGAPRRVIGRDASVIPITAADSIVTALRIPRLLGDRLKNWRPRIAAIDADESPVRRPAIDARPIDDYEAVLRGLHAFHERWQPRWRYGRVDPIDAHREWVMAGHLTRFLRDGCEVLFVCGAAHWAPIVARLESGAVASAQRLRLTGGRRRNPELVSIAPETAWLNGFLDDTPAVVLDYERALQQGREQSWDKREAVTRLTRTAIDAASRDGIAVSPCHIGTMSRYLDVLLTSAGRWVPELDDHLVHSARACVGVAFATKLKELAHEYPGWSADRGLAREVLRTPDGALVIHSGSEYLVVKGHPEASWRRRIPLQLLTMTRTERAALDGGWVFRDWPAEQTLHSTLTRRARRLAHDPVEVMTSPFSCGLGDGIAWRQSLRGRIEGRTNVYVRRHVRRHPPVRCDGTCPVVWILDAAAPIVGTFTGFAPWHRHGWAHHCYSAFYWLKGSRRLGDSPIQQLTVAYTVSLLRGVLPPPVDDPKAVAALVASLPERRRATIAPWHDDSLRDFTRSDLAIACAIKHAGDHVVVVSREPSGSAIRAFAKARGVRILDLGHDAFNAADLARLSLDHNVPAPAQYAQPFPWVERFIGEATALT